MPRPRVPIENRQRAVRACVAYKTSKKRCNSRIPCSSCVKRNCEHACLYEDARQLVGQTASAASRSTVPQQSKDGAQSHPKQASLTQAPVQTPTLHEGDAAHSHSYSSPVNRSKDQQGRYEVRAHEDGTLSPTMEATLFPRSRLMLNVNGEKGTLICRPS
jgi:hypothetical protein